MKCKQVQSLLVSYLNKETTPSEQALIQAHLSGCPACQEELSRIADVQGQVSVVLQRRAAQATPSADAWERLEVRLVQDAQPAPVRGTWLSHLAPSVNRIHQHFSGGATMRKQTIWAAGLAVLAIAVVAVLMFNNVSNVSAQTIIERASAAQAAVQSAPGLKHYRIEIYKNPLAEEGDQAGATTITESYEYFSQNLFRDETRDTAGNLVSVNAMDGTYGYWMPPTTSGPLVVQRRTLSAEELRKASAADAQASADNSATSLFDHYRNNPRVELQGKQTRPDGTRVYVLLDRNYQGSQDGGQTYTGSMSMVFDAQTYRLLESETTVHKNGKDIVIERVRFLVEETLPVDTPIVWNLSDLRNVTIVDEVQEKPTEQAPVSFETISPEQLAVQPNLSSTAYVLKKLPAGVTQEIVAAANQPQDQPYGYEIHYRDQAGEEYLGLQAVGTMDAGFVETSFYDGSYKAANGLVLNYSSSRPQGSPKGTAGMLTLPDGTCFLLDSTLSREEVQKLVEDLIPLK
jgi:hypothetical protein